MVDQERLLLDGGVWDEIMAGNLMLGDLEITDGREVQLCHHRRGLTLKVMKFARTKSMR